MAELKLKRKRTVKKVEPLNDSNWERSPIILDLQQGDRVRCEFIPSRWAHQLVVGKIYTVEQVTGQLTGDFRIIGHEYGYSSRCFKKIGTMNIQVGDRVRWDGHWPRTLNWHGGCDQLVKNKVYKVIEVLPPTAGGGSHQKIAMIKLRGISGTYTFPVQAFTQVVFKPHDRPAIETRAVTPGMAAPQVTA